MARGLATNQRSVQHRAVPDLANCGLITGAIPTNDPIFSDGFTGAGVNRVRVNLDDLGIFGTQVER